MNFVSNGLADIFIQKLDPKGNLIWIKSMGAGQRDEGLAIDQDGSGNLIIAGEFRKTVDFDPGPSVLELTSIGSSDAYVLKLNRNGNFIWAKSMGGKSNVWASQIAADKDNNVYLIGGFRDTADFDPGISNYNLISVGDEDIFIQKLDSNGNFLWAKSVGGIEQDIGFSLSLDNSGNVYVCGEFRDSVDFDPGLGTHYEKPSNLYGSYLLKLNSNGDFIWVNTFSGSRTSGRSLSIDNKGDIVLTGRSGSNGTSYVAKLDSSGNNLWSNSSGNNSSYVGSVESKIDLNGNIFVLGEFFGQVDFNPDVTTR